VEAPCKKKNKEQAKKFFLKHLIYVLIYNIDEEYKKIKDSLREPLKRIKH
jgi:hypothetical protein